MKSIAVVLAAGLGTRMKSCRPKVLHEIAGLPMIQHVINALKEAGTGEIILVLGYQGEAVVCALGPGYQIVHQNEQLGTGHALLQALPILEKYTEGECLVLCGDTPLLKSQTLRLLREKHSANGASATILTALFSNPAGYGRIVRNSRGVQGIVEEKDASPEEKQINEINTGTYCYNIISLKERLTRLEPTNVQGEYYLTDVIKMLAQDGDKIETLVLEDPLEAMGINNRIQLAEAGTHMRRRILEKHMLEGVTIIDPANTYIETGVTIGRDTIIYPGVYLEGSTSVGENCRIGPDSKLVDSQVGDEVSIQYSNLLKARVGRECTIGPYSYLRPGTVLGQGVKVGDFAEVKNSIVGDGSKIPHLSYVGDSTLGENVNIGAGTITCNYDGTNKYHTEIGDGAFIGSNTNLVAPIKVGAKAYIGAGSTVTKDIPPQALAIARGKQRNIENWSAGRNEETERDQHRED